MRYALILNPAAGGGRAARLGPRLREACSRAGLDAELFLTRAPGEATPLARALAERSRAETSEANRFRAVVAVGGDGTASEVAAGLAGTGVPLGLIPAGTGNDVARLLGVPRGLGPALRALAEASAQELDLIHVTWGDLGPDGTPRTGERVAINALGVGFDAAVAVEAERYKGHAQRAAYLGAVLRMLRRWPQPPATVEIEGPDGQIERMDLARLFLVEAGNGQAVGGGFRLTPGAHPADGLLEACVVGHVPPLRALRLLPSVFWGGHTAAPEVRTRPALRVRVLAEAYVLPAHADGEALTSSAKRVEASVLPGALRVLAPGLQMGTPSGHRV